MIQLLKYGIYAKSVKLLCFKPAWVNFPIWPEIDVKVFKKKVKSANERIALSLCLAFAIWTKEITETTADNCILPKLLPKAMIADKQGGSWVNVSYGY